MAEVSQAHSPISYSWPIALLFPVMNSQNMQINLRTFLLLCNNFSFNVFVSLVKYYTGIMHEDKNQESNLQEAGHPFKVLQSKPMQILPFFCTRNFLLPLKVVLHFQASKENIKPTTMNCVISHNKIQRALVQYGLSINDIFNYTLIYSSKLSGDNILDLSWYYNKHILVLQELDRNSWIAAFVVFKVYPVAELGA